MLKRLRCVARYENILPEDDDFARGRRSVTVFQDKVTRAVVIRTAYHDSTVWEAFLAESHLLFKGQTEMLEKQIEMLHYSPEVVDYQVERMLHTLEQQMVKEHD